MITFTGRIRRGGGAADYYEAKYFDNGSPVAELCATYSNYVKTTRWIKPEECHAWGYEGVGPELLALNILSWHSYRTTGQNPEIARKYYKEFTTEVIANLPDTWEMTSEQINQWLENKQTKTKGHGNAHDTERERT